MRKSKTNVMRTPEEKELIVLETFENGVNKTFKKHGVDKRLLQRWIKKYRENGIDGLRSKTGKSPLCHQTLPAYLPVAGTLQSPSENMV